MRVCARVHVCVCAIYMYNSFPLCMERDASVHRSIPAYIEM